MGDAVPVGWGRGVAELLEAPEVELRGTVARAEFGGLTEAPCGSRALDVACEGMSFPL